MPINSRSCCNALKQTACWRFELIKWQKCSSDIINAQVIIKIMVVLIYFFIMKILLSSLDDLILFWSESDWFIGHCKHTIAKHTVHHNEMCPRYLTPQWAARGCSVWGWCLAYKYFSCSCTSLEIRNGDFPMADLSHS